MKYVLLFGGTNDEAAWAELEPGRADAVMGEIIAWWEQHAAAGTILGGERLQGSSTATTVRMGGDGSVQLIDGPFIEAKEEVGGYGLIEAADLDAALALARTWPALQVPGESVEVRPVFEM